MPTTDRLKIGALSLHHIDLSAATISTFQINARVQVGAIFTFVMLPSYAPRKEDGIWMGIGRFCPRTAVILFVCSHQTIVCCRQTIVWPRHTIVCSRQTTKETNEDY